MKRLFFVISILLLIWGCQKPGFFFNPPDTGNGNNNQVAHLLDGVNDFSMDEIAGIDKVGDISEPNLDLDTLWAVKGDSMLYIGFNAHSSAGYGMSYGIYIFTDSIYGSGAGNDPWNRLVDYTGGIYPPYVVYFWHADNVDSITSAQFITFNGSWNYTDIGRDVFIYNGSLDFMEVFIPLEWLGNPESIYIEVFTTGGENSHAQDTSPEDGNVQFPDPEWTQTTVSLSSAVPVK
ncbi:hypothetical protein DRQ17_07540 [bacterium]|nr:MAG: hypothetical protein DRQ17_07540 [bacterium]